MPAFVRKRGTKYRVVEKKSKGNIVLVKNKKGTSVDGGGHATKKKAESQARAINANS